MVLTGGWRVENGPAGGAQVTVVVNPALACLATLGGHSQGCSSSSQSMSPALLASTGPMMWQAHPRQVGDDVAPTSLDEGRGEGVMELMVVFRLDPKCCSVDG